MVIKERMTKLYALLNTPDHVPYEFGPDVNDTFYVDVCVDPGNSWPDNAYPPEYVPLAKVAGEPLAALMAKSPQMLELITYLYWSTLNQSSSFANDVYVRTEKLLRTLPKEFQEILLGE